MFKPWFKQKPTSIFHMYRLSFLSSSFWVRLLRCLTHVLTRIFWISQEIEKSQRFWEKKFFFKIQFSLNPFTLRKQNQNWNQIRGFIDASKLTVNLVISGPVYKWKWKWKIRHSLNMTLSYSDELKNDDDEKEE
mgnify:CR=1 FL=1